MEYVAVAENSETILTKMVNELIKEGWKPFGSLSCALVQSTDGDGVWNQYSQAMIKE